MSYSYSRIGQQKQLQQFRTTYGHRISILGVWQPKQSFDYAQVPGSFTKQRYVKVMNWIAQCGSPNVRPDGSLDGHRAG